VAKNAPPLLPSLPATGGWLRAVEPVAEELGLAQVTSPPDRSVAANVLPCL